MASARARLAANAEGAFFVDATCIDCATCRWMAPATFDQDGGFSRVFAQPGDAAQRHRAAMALLACPVSAIGATEKVSLGAAKAAFPDPVADNVYCCGYHARSSFGAASYLIRRKCGNVLIDSPRFTAALVRRLEEMGGVSVMFLTHRDDVADHARFRAHFGCERILHEDDVGYGTRDVERPLAGHEPVALDDDILLIPVPGHTRGSVCLLYGDKFLFSGDHVSWKPDAGRVRASPGVCWHDWEEQTRSMERLAEYRFEWILPGHGFRCHYPADAMAAEMRRCAEWMRSGVQHR